LIEYLRKVNATIVEDHRFDADPDLDLHLNPIENDTDECLFVG
jgi:hypothetical protein